MPYLDENGYWKPTPEFEKFKHPEKLRRSFYEEEFRRWREGYGNLTGAHYFHITWGCIIKGTRGSLIRPIWRDGDVLVFEAYKECLDTGYDLAVFKRREYGLTSIFGGCIPVYNSLVYPGSVNLITSADKDRTEMVLNQKIRPYLLGVKEFLPYKNDKPNYYDNGSMIQLMPKDNKNTRHGSMIYCRETSDTPASVQNFESFRALFVFLDEFFIHSRAQRVKDSVEDCLMDGNKKKGILVMGGSCNNMNKESTRQLGNLIKKSSSEKVKILFLPAWLCMDGDMDENGFSLKDQALEKIYKRREELRADENWSKLNNYIKSRPIYLTELFEAEDANTISPDIVHNIKKGKILALDNPPLQCDLYSHPTLGVQTQKDQNGCYFIYQHPQPGHTYIAGLDPIPFNTENMSEERSKFCCVIKDVDTNQYVAYLMIRTPDAEEVYEKWHKLLLFYRSNRFPLGAHCMVEKNRAEAIMTLCRLRHTTHLLAGDPVKMKKNYNDRGYYKNGDMVEKLHTLLMGYMKYNILPFEQALNEMSDYPVGNSDILDAIQACEYLHSFFRNVKKNQAPEKHYVIKKQGGRTVGAWEEKSPGETFSLKNYYYTGDEDHF